MAEQNAYAILNLRKGATEQEIARGLGISAATVRRRWAFARTWLLRELRES